MRLLTRSAILLAGFVAVKHGEDAHRRGIAGEGTRSLDGDLIAPSAAVICPGGIIYLRYNGLLAL